MDLRDSIIKTFDLLSIYTTIDDGPNYKFKVTAFENAAKAVEGYEGDINKILDHKVDKLGESSREVIYDLINLGYSSRLRELELKYPGEKKAFDYFTRYYGIGVVNALEYYRRGYTNIKQVWDNNLLTHAQKEGVIWFKHIRLSISQAEMDSINRSITESLLTQFNNFRSQIVGSYRRKTGKYSDIDLLVSGITMDDIISRLGNKIVSLFSKGDIMTSGMYRENNNENAHRIDIRVSGWNEYYVALLYFTGSRDFNIRMREYAKSKGYQLTNDSLYKIDVNGTKNQVRIGSEHEIFRELGLEYVPPENRN